MPCRRAVRMSRCNALPFLPKSHGLAPCPALFVDLAAVRSRSMEYGGALSAPAELLCMGWRMAILKRAPCLTLRLRFPRTSPFSEKCVGFGPGASDPGAHRGSAEAPLNPRVTVAPGTFFARPG